MSTPAAEVRTAWDLVRRGPFSRLWWAGVIGSTGDWITIFAVLVVGNNIAGSTGTLVAIVSRLLPGLVFGPFAGVFTDRLNRKRLIMVAEFGRGLVVPLLVFADTLLELVLVTLVLEVLSLLGQSPRAAIIPTLVKPRHIVTANSLTLAAVFGTVPLAAGINWALGYLPELTFNGFVPEPNREVATAFFVDAFSFIVSGIIVATIAISARDATARRAATEAPASPLRDVWAGIRYIWGHKGVRRVLAGIGVGLFGGGAVVSLGPKFAQEVLGADSRGFFAIVALFALGAAAGIALVSLYGSRFQQRDLVFAVFVISGGAGLVAAAVTNTVSGAASWMFILGFGSGSAYVMGFTHLHEEVEDDYRGRVFATLYILIRVGLFGAATLAVPLAGFFNSNPALSPFNRGTRDVLFLGGIVMIITGLVTLLNVLRALGWPVVDERARRTLSSAVGRDESGPAANVSGTESEGEEDGP
jgi:dTMP kinase